MKKMTEEDWTKMFEQMSVEEIAPVLTALLCTQPIYVSAHGIGYTPGWHAEVGTEGKLAIFLTGEWDDPPKVMQQCGKMTGKTP